MTSLHFTDADRDERGFIKTPEPRTLADLLPPPIDTAPQAARPSFARSEWRVYLAFGLGLLILIGYTAVSGGANRAAPISRNATAPAPTAPAPATATKAPIPTAVSDRRQIDAYAAPGGVVLGPIESDRTIVAVAHYGTDWIQADVSGSGRIWLRTSDWPEKAIIGPDLEPPPTVVPEIVPTTPPPPCASAGIPGKMVEVCGEVGIAALEQQARDQWIATYGGHAGIVTTPTPPDWSRP